MVSSDTARHVKPRVPQLLGDNRSGGGMRRLVARFMYERPGEAPATRGRRADTSIHGGLRGEALQPPLRGAVPRNRRAIADDAEAPAGYVQAGHFFQANPASLCLAILGGGAQGQKDPDRRPELRRPAIRGPFPDARGAGHEPSVRPGTCGPVVGEFEGAQGGLPRRGRIHGDP